MKVLQLGKGLLIAKIDIKSAYRLVPVSPLDSHYLGTQWDGQICRWYVPFGLRSAPKIFNALADALEWCMNKEGVQDIFHYLDEFAIIGTPNSEQCSWNLHFLQRVSEDLSIPLAQAGPCTTIEFLGIIIDTTHQERQLMDRRSTLYVQESQHTL